MSSSLQVRLDTTLKKTVEKILAEMGLDASTAVRMLFAKIAKTKSLPFRVDLSTSSKLTENGFTKEEEDEILRAANDDESYGPFSPKEALAFLDSIVAEPRVKYTRKSGGLMTSKKQTNEDRV